MSVSTRRLVLHAQWSDGAIHLWGELAASDSAPLSANATRENGGEKCSGEQASTHPFSAPADVLRKALGFVGETGGIEDGAITMRLPAVDGVPIASPHMAHAGGGRGRRGGGVGGGGGGSDGTDSDAMDPDALAIAGNVDFEDPEDAVTLAEDAANADVTPVVEAAPITPAAAPTLVSFRVPTLRVRPVDVPRVLDALEEAADQETDDALVAAESLRYFAAAGRFARHLLAQQRFVPMLQQDSTGTLSGVWQPWLADEQTTARVQSLLKAMPRSCRAAADAFEHDPWLILDDFLLRVGDALCRRVLAGEQMRDAIDGRDPANDPHVSWLTGLLDVSSDIDTRPGPRNDLIKGTRRWIGGLEERGSGAAWRLMLKLAEPLDLRDLAAPDPDSGAQIDSVDKVRWTLSLHLQNVMSPEVVVDASDIWLLPPGAASVEGLRIEQPQELMLAELGRAARLYKKLEKVLEDAEPTELELSTSDAYKFLREVRPVLIEQGYNVAAPVWWDSPTVRLGAKLIVQSEDVDLSTIGAIGLDGAGGAGAGVGGAPKLGLSSLVSYRWQIAVGETNLTLEQFERLAAQHSPLIRLNGRWVEIRPEDVKAAIKFIRENQGSGETAGKMEVGRALRLAYASDVRDTGIPILGMEATGWVDAVFGDAAANTKMPMLESPQGFVGTLRAYQLKGLSWLAFLDKLGLGACLADDMGLGKTVQLLALLAHERSLAVQHAQAHGLARPVHSPTLLIVPMSVVANWVHEAKRFTPNLRVLVHHGLTRQMGESLLQTALENDIVVTTYALAHRDREQLSKVPWGRVVLDEAQNIKNPTAKQTRAIHSIPAPRRFALTGTPLENRLIELWSIMDFLNPAYLGPAGEFRTRFAVPIERYHDKLRGAQLRGLVQPFILRRLKSDPTVITDLPDKVESKEYCYLTPEQATLYQTCVADMLGAAERAEGIQRRGVVLAGLIKLKQICNHPAHFLKEFGESASNVPAIAPGRSGKTQRLVEMLQEVVAAGDKALVFTQFRQMSLLLASMLRQTLDRDVLLLHGGTSPAQRQNIIAEFQGDKAKMSKVRPGNAPAPPVLILSLKAGGVGLNLTAANHVFHFDRWWNPAVESQATDRAYRIGQTRTVQVHKFVVSGTLEERIDQMIEEKTQLADQIIGHGETWLTELSTSQLRDLLTLRADAVETDADEPAPVFVPKDRPVAGREEDTGALP
ncbi:MAG: DEAD/DEAH box helicase [Phycisphaerales bacterium]|nr:DEAD/DEAH box helicase [Phycisphaerales bacterium]